MVANQPGNFVTRVLLTLVLSVAFIGTPSLATTIPSKWLQDNPAVDDSANLVENGDFTNWKEGQPVGWDVGIGAKDGANQPLSRLAKGKGPSLELSGSAKTMAWQFVSQSIDVKPEMIVRVSFQAKANGLRRQGRQKNNCYLAFVPKNAQGKNVSPQFWNIQSTEYQPFSHNVTVPKEAKSAEIWIFLSKTGTLNVKGIEAEPLLPEQSFDILVEDMGRNYSFFELKKIDWKALSDRYRKRATEAATPKEFAKVVAEMLGELDDMHTWAIHNKARYSEFKGGYDANCDFHVVAKSLVQSTPFRGLGIVGKTKDGFCYVNLRTLTLPNPILMREPPSPDFKPSDRPLTEILDQIAAAKDAPGLILDIRQNNGGDERMARKIAGMFFDQETVYAKSVYRDADSDTGFEKPNSRMIRPTGNKTFKGPIVCLIGPGTVSSAEGMAMMMKALPNCTLIGKPTRGASGNPRPVQLPNGVDVWYSRWQSQLPDGTPIEGVGIEPDIEVEHKQGSDRTYEKAIEILKAKQK